MEGFVETCGGRWAMTEHGGVEGTAKIQVSGQTFLAMLRGVVSAAQAQTYSHGALPAKADAARSFHYQCGVVPVSISELNFFKKNYFFKKKCSPYRA